jgi:hypothetical protein
MSKQDKVRKALDRIPTIILLWILLGALVGGIGAFLLTHGDPSWLFWGVVIGMLPGAVGGFLFIWGISDVDVPM